MAVICIYVIIFGSLNLLILCEYWINEGGMTGGKSSEGLLNEINAFIFLTNRPERIVEIELFALLKNQSFQWHNTFSNFYFSFIFSVKCKTFFPLFTNSFYLEWATEGWITPPLRPFLLRNFKMFFFLFCFHFSLNEAFIKLLNENYW